MVLDGPIYLQPRFRTALDRDRVSVLTLSMICPAFFFPFVELYAGLA